MFTEMLDNAYIYIYIYIPAQKWPALLIKFFYAIMLLNIGFNLLISMFSFKCKPMTCTVESSSCRCFFGTSPS